MKAPRPPRLARVGSGVILLLSLASGAGGQVVIDGHLRARDQGDPSREAPLTGVLAIGSLPGSQHEATSFRSWETHPAGWFRLSGSAGSYTLAFTNPAHFVRPQVLTNVTMRDGEKVVLHPPARFDYACFHDRDWDPKPALHYLQPFVARGTSITAVGFKLATDGVDGAGPGSQDVLISIHRLTDDPPDQWPQVGPTATVLGVDCGGPKSYWYSAGWQSGEVATEPGQRLAVSLRPANPDGGHFQAFWRERTGGSPGVYRISGEERRFEDRDLWMTVASDGDGLLIPYNKRVHRKFSTLTNIDRRWSQTWIAQGHGLASVVLYAAVSGKQPPLSRQRVVVRVRADGPDGPVVGIEKIAVGNGDYTGDASWGHFVAVFAPGEVPLTPGRTYALEFESIETAHTIADFVNIKGQVSDGRAGFNPYRKCEPDDYPSGTAFRGGTEAQDFDLDMQVVEYAVHRPDWSEALAGRDLLRGEAAPPDRSPADLLAGWSPVRVEAETKLSTIEAPEHGEPFLRVEASRVGAAVDGGWVRVVTGIERNRTYRLSGEVRSTWPAGIDHRCRVGLDPTGQATDPHGQSIQWMVLPPRHGEWIPFQGAPLRPEQDRLSIWLQASCHQEDARFPFQGDFRNLSLRTVDSGIPSQQERQARSGFLDRIPPEAPDAQAARRARVLERRESTPVLVHRGASRFAPENTLAAFTKALDRGADGIEVDIRRSCDGVLYVFHDETLDRMTDGSGPVHGRSYFDLLGSRVGEGDHRIPTLASVFTLARDRAALLHLDVKEAGLEQDLLRMIEAADLWNHIVEVNPNHAGSLREHARIRRMAYKGWFPEEPGQRASFLARPGAMIFTKWDPLEAVEAVGRAPGESLPPDPRLRCWWEPSGPEPNR